MILDNIPLWLKNVGVITGVIGLFGIIIKEIISAYVNIKGKNIDVKSAEDIREDTKEVELKRISVDEKEQLIRGMDTFQKGLMSELDSLRKELWTVKEKVTSQQNEILSLMLENFNIRNENAKLAAVVQDMTIQLDEMKVKNQKLTEALLLSDKRVAELEQELTHVKEHTVAQVDSLIASKYTSDLKG